MSIQCMLTRSDRRTLAISVTKDGKVVAKAPLLMSIETINKFLQEKQHWIEERLKFVQGNINKHSDVISYKKFLLFGQEYEPWKANVSTMIFSEQLKLLVPEKLEDAEILLAIKKHYIKLAKKFLVDRALAVAKTMGMSPKVIKISNAHGRWGSCNSKNVISICWKTIMLEPSLIDYIVIHEISHLFEMNHSAKFWKKVSKYYPNFRLARQKLKEYSFVMELFRL